MQQLKANLTIWSDQMTIPEKDGIKNRTFSLQKTYSVVDVCNKRHDSWLCGQ